MAEAAPLQPRSNRTVFTKDLSAPDPVPGAGIEAANKLLRDGRLFRYGEDRNSLPEAALLEEEFAAYLGRRYAVGVNSGGWRAFPGAQGGGRRAGRQGPGQRLHPGARCPAPSPTPAREPVLVEVDEQLSYRPGRPGPQGGGLGRPGPAAVLHARAHPRHGPVLESLPAPRPDPDRGLRPHHGRRVGRPAERHLRRGLLLQQPDLQAHQLGRRRASGDRRSGPGGQGDPAFRQLHALRPAPGPAAARGLRAPQVRHAELLDADVEPVGGASAAAAGRAGDPHRGLAADLRQLGPTAEPDRPHHRARRARPRKTSCRARCSSR